MGQLFIYLLKANVIIIMQFFFYIAFLRKEKYFKAHRFFLLFVLGFALLLPSVPSVDFSFFTTIQKTASMINPINRFYGSVEIQQQFSNDKQSPGQLLRPNLNLLKSWSFTEWIFFMYAGICSCLLIRLVLNLIKLVLFLRNTRRVSQDGIWNCDTDIELAPFSFFNFLVVNQSLYSKSQLKHIVAHEQVHIHGWHSADTLIVELMHCIFWFNPIMVYIKRSIKLNHEFIADESVVINGIDKRAYQYNILQTALKLNKLPLTNLYSTSKLKIRIRMMNKEQRTSKGRYKYALAIPIIFISYLVINPAIAGSSTSIKYKIENLAAYEGRYQLQSDHSAYMSIKIVNHVLVAKELWSGKEHPIQKLSPVDFRSKEGYPVHFTINDKGQVTKVRALNRDTWIKIKDQVVHHMIKLDQEQLKALTGLYNLKNNPDAYQLVTVGQDGLILKQLWNGAETTFTPESELLFFIKDANFSIQFLKDPDGAAREFITSNNHVWSKVTEQEPSPVISLSSDDLKKFEGKYEYRNKKGAFIEIMVIDGGLSLKQDWDGKEISFVPKSPLFFSAAKQPLFSLEFSQNTDGRITQVLAFGKDPWDKM